MDSKFHFNLLLLLSSWVLVGVSQNLNELAKAYGDTISSFMEGTGGVGASSFACVEKLLPCESSMNSSPPPETCCALLKEMVANESKCLCSVFNNPTVLLNFNITKDDALNLAKNCGANPDVSVCEIPKSASSSQTSYTSSTVNTEDSHSGSSSSSNSSDRSTKTNAAYKPYVELSAIVFFFVGLNFWAF